MINMLNLLSGKPFNNSGLNSPKLSSSHIFKNKV